MNRRKISMKLLGVILSLALLVTMVFISAVPASAAELGEAPEAVLAFDGSVVLFDEVALVATEVYNVAAPPAEDSAAPFYMIVAALVTCGVVLTLSQRRNISRNSCRLASRSNTFDNLKGRTRRFQGDGICSAPSGA